MTSQSDSATGRLFEDARASTQVEYHEESGTFRTEFDAHDRRASAAISTTVAAATDRDPLDLPPLYAAVDPEALETIVESSAEDPPSVGTVVEFEYADCQVTVNGHGTVAVTPASSTR